MPRLIAVVAISDDGVIGKDGALPWGRISADLRHFKKVTQAIGAVVMGRKTADSLPGPLPGRVNYVLSRDATRVREGFTHIASLAALKALPHDDIAVIGGSYLYLQLLPCCAEAHVTRVHTTVGDGDLVVRFPVSAMVNFRPLSIRDVPSTDPETPDLQFIHAINPRPFPIF